MKVYNRQTRVSIEYHALGFEVYIFSEDDAQLKKFLKDFADIFTCSDEELAIYLTSPIFGERLIAQAIMKRKNYEYS